MYWVKDVALQLVFESLLGSVAKTFWAPTPNSFPVEVIKLEERGMQVSSGPLFSIKQCKESYNVAKFWNPPWFIGEWGPRDKAVTKGTIKFQRSKGKRIANLVALFESFNRQGPVSAGFFIESFPAWSVFRHYLQQCPSESTFKVLQHEQHMCSSVQMQRLHLHARFKMRL